MYSMPALLRRIRPGETDGYRPGWCRVSFSHLMTPQEVDYVIRAVLEVATLGWKLLPLYDADCASGAIPPQLWRCLCPACAA